MGVLRHLKDKEARQLVKEFVGRYPASEQLLKSAKQFEELNIEDGSVIIVDGRPLILRTKIGLLPSLKFEELLPTLSRVVVDMGAVPHIVNGAQVMRPGVRQILSDFGKGELVAIVDEKFSKTIALGIADVDSTTMRSVSKGKVVQNIHYVGDDFWKASTV